MKVGCLSYLICAFDDNRTLDYRFYGLVTSNDNQTLDNGLYGLVNFVEVWHVRVVVRLSNVYYIVKL